MESLPGFLLCFDPPQTSNEDLRRRVQDGRVSQLLAFDGVEFQNPIDLSGITFEQGLQFRRCIFDEPVSFVGASLIGYARFWKCIFRKPADFKYAAFKRHGTGPLRSTENGEANFSWSRFEGEADFLWAQFEGPAFFWRTVFEKFVKLEATFKSSATFEGDRRLVSLERRDFGSRPDLFAALNASGLLSQDNEDRHCAMLAPVADHVLELRLRDIGVNADSVKHVLSVVRRSQAGVFSDHGASFCRANFEAPESVAFSNLDLQTCRFLNSNAGRVRFQNVRWDRQPTFLWAADRRAVSDERTPARSGTRSTEELRALGTLYNDLRIAHAGRGLYDDALDFQFGEMESKRLTQPRYLRHVSLAAWYKYLSAYGTRPGLALFWLLLGIFVLFPALFWLSGYSHRLLDVVVHSLETTTFLEAGKGSSGSVVTLSIPDRLIAGLERLAIAFQAALFAFSIQQKFGRK